MSVTLGQRASRSLTLTAEHVLKYAEISGDHNPLHFDAAVAARTKFGRLVSRFEALASRWHGRSPTRRLPGGCRRVSPASLPSGARLACAGTRARCGSFGGVPQELLFDQMKAGFRATCGCARLASSYSMNMTSPWLARGEAQAPPG
jgi:hypothetical protein